MGNKILWRDVALVCRKGQGLEHTHHCPAVWLAPPPLLRGPSSSSVHQKLLFPRRGDPAVTLLPLSEPFFLVGEARPHEVGGV